MIKNRVTNNGIDNNSDCEEKKSQESKYSVFENIKEFYDERNPSKLALVVEEFLVHSILIIVDHLLFRTDHSVESIISLDRDIIDTDGVRERVFSGIFYEVGEIWVSNLEDLESFFFGNRCDTCSGKSIFEVIDKKLRIEIIERISTLEVDREGYMIIDSCDKFL